MHYVCSTSVDLLADSEKFPDHWLFKHRWGKGKKGQSAVLPNGEKIVYLTVGGRTSAVVPSIQKKTGPVTQDISEEAANGTQVKTKRKRGAAVKQEDDADEDELEEASTKQPAPKRRNSRSAKAEKAEEDIKPANLADVGRRRSARTRK